MGVKPSDGGGIIGTPLEPLKASASKSLRKLSPGDRIAPTRETYLALAAQQATQDDRALMDAAAVEAAGPSNLHQSQREKGAPAPALEDIMDEEDRTNMTARLKTSIARKGTVEGRGTGWHVPFVVAASGVPEIVPRPRTMSVGHAILRQGVRHATERDKPRSRFANAAAGMDDAEERYRLSDLFAMAALHSRGTHGLGYDEDGTGADQKGVGEGVKMVRKGGKLALVAAEEKRPQGQEEDEHGYDELANEGYKDLDAAADRVRLSLLRQRRQKMARSTAEQKRSAHIAGLDASPHALFAQFGLATILEYGPQDGEDADTTVPLSFAEKPMHDFASDPFAGEGVSLPEGLREEHDALAKAHWDVLEDEGRSVNAAIAQAKEKREEKLRRVRAQFLEDISVKFVPPGETRRSDEACTGGAVTVVARGESGAARKEGGGVAPIIGKSNRTLHKWEPCALLCKRFGIIRSKQEPASKETPDVGKSARQSSLSDHGSVRYEDVDDEDNDDEDEDFQVHAIIGADGRRIDFDQAARGVIDDDAVVVTSLEPQRVLTAKRPEVNPSLELYRVIFTESAGGGSEQDKSQPGAGGEGPPRSGDSQERTGVHKTRAADFF